MAKNIIIADFSEKSGFALPFPKGDIASVHFADIDLIITTKTGAHFVLPGAALASMEEKPPSISFKDGSTSADQLLSHVETPKDLALDIQTVSNIPAPKNEPQQDTQELLKKQTDLKQKFEQDLAKAREDLAQLKDKLNARDETIDQQELKIAQLSEQNSTDKAAQPDESQQIKDHDKIVNASESAEQSSSIDQYTEKMAALSQEFHTKDFDYVPLRPFEAPSQVFMGPPGVPAPLSMTPLVTLSMGNVIGTQSSTDGFGVTTVYGGGGATGSSAEAKLGPRDALQFSAATINGTAGDDIIYAQGPLLGNADPLANIDHYAKQFLLKIAGYFTDLNAIVFKGLPSYVSVSHATQNADGSWSLPSSAALKQESFELVYDKTAAQAAGLPSFDMTVEINGLMRGTAFNSVEKFRFQFMDVAESAQSTNPLLTYWDDGASKQIYVLPTLDQPNIITAGEGNDRVYGSQSHDTIDGGAGNDQIWGYGGNNIITGGTGNDTISATDGNNTIDTGDGVNAVTVGHGTNSITGGSLADTIIAGNGINTINAGNGDNIITVGNGANGITAGSGNDTITTGDGNNTIDAGDGTNTITTGSGTDTIRTWGGDDTINAGAGNDTLSGGLGTNQLNGGGGLNTVDYTSIGVAMTVSLATNSATGAGVADTYSDIHNVIGSALADTITGTTGDNTLRGGAGNDTISGNGGNDAIYGDAGDDTLTGSAGNDVIDGGDGADTMRGGGGTDILRGGAGDDVFLTPTAGSVYEGGDGTDKVDYSGETNQLIIDLGARTGIGGTAQNSSYNSIEWIIGGTRDDVITGSNGNDILEGRDGNDTLAGGLGSNTLIGGNGYNNYRMFAGFDTIEGNGGGYDILSYDYSPAAIVVNLDNVAHSFTNSLGQTITVDALSGSHRGETANDLNAYSIGDTYSNGGIDHITGTSRADVIFASSVTAANYRGYGGADLIYGYGMNDSFEMDGGGNYRIDGGGGNDRIYTGYSSYNITVYLDGMADIDNNGRADYLDKGASVLAGSGYTGFMTGWGGVPLFINVESILGGSGSDLFVGDDNANELNARWGNNTIHGRGGDDLIFNMDGANTIDGGTGSDTISFIREGISVGYGSSDLATGVSCYLADADLNNDGSLDKAATWGSHSADHARITYAGFVYYSSVANVENIHGTNYDDLLAGDANANIIYGNSGNDTITGNGGADSLYGHAGNDTFVVSSSHIGSITLMDGSTGTDSVRSSGWTFDANSFNNATMNTRFSSIESLDVRNQASGQAYGLNALDIQSIVDSGASSVLELRLDTGDTLSLASGAGTGALSVLNTAHTATYDQYKLYSDSGHVINNSTNLVAILNVYYGT